jgi:crotonobetainyl-CoA:carnitine CoA-transferase CaiB-like acyl-CoA transferase
MGLGSIGTEAAAALGLDHAVDLVGPPLGTLPWVSSLPVGALAEDSVALASLAVDLAASVRSGSTPAALRIDRSRMATSFTSERVLRVDGEPPAVWAPLSGFWRAGDGWVRTHANYPHHERALRRVLGLEADAEKEAVVDAVSAWNAVDLETAAAEVGAIVGAVRTPAEWSTCEQAGVVRSAPLIERTRLPGAPPRAWPTGGPPLAGIRVLDLTRVLAGPVAARDLATAGAEVLRVDAPFLPETGWIHLDTGQGKRSTQLDLRSPADRSVFEELLAGADAVLTGYRPGALARFGLDPIDLAERHPGLVTGSVSAWGARGPWAQRRGFDSIVQAVTGIAMVESADGTTPGSLPAQALDHTTGHLLAAAVISGLMEQRRDGGAPDLQLSLARTAQALVDAPDPVAAQVADPDPHHGPEPTTRTRALQGYGPASLTYAAPVLAFAGAADDYPVVGGLWGVDPPEWRTAHGR